MYSYIIVRIQPTDGVTQSIHEVILGRQCQIKSLEIGQRGWLLVNVGNDSFGPHRIALSSILRISGDEDICIETVNTIYCLKKVAEMIICSCSSYRTPSIGTILASLHKTLHCFSLESKGNYSPLSNSVKCTSRSLEYFFSCSNKRAPRSK